MCTQASEFTAHALIVAAVCGVLLGIALWLAAPNLISGRPALLQVAIRPNHAVQKQAAVHGVPSSLPAGCTDCFMQSAPDCCSALHHRRLLARCKLPKCKLYLHYTILLLPPTAVMLPWSRCNSCCCCCSCCVLEFPEARRPAESQNEV